MATAKPDKHLAQFQRITRRQIAELNAEASQKRIENQAAELVKKHLKAEEKKAAEALAKEKIKEMGGAGIGTGTAKQKARNSTATNKRNQKQATVKATKAKGKRG